MPVLIVALRSGLPAAAMGARGTACGPAASPSHSPHDQASETQASAARCIKASCCARAPNRSGLSPTQRIPPRTALRVVPKHRERGYSCNRLRGGESVGATLRVRNTVDRGLRLSSVINIKYSVLLLLSARASALPSRRALLAGGGAERVAQVCFGSGCTECQHALRPRPRLRLRGPRAGGHLRPQLHAEVGGA